MLRLADGVRDFVDSHRVCFDSSVLFEEKMVSFEEFYLLLVLYYDAKLISDEDFVVLYEMFQSTNSSFPYYEYPRFDLNNMN